MIEIKKLSEHDLIEDIVDAIKRSSWSEESEIEINDYSVETLKNSLSQNNHIFCVAYLDGEFAGMASAFVLLRPDGDAWLYVNEVDVNMEKQRNGVGTALMEFLRAEGKQHGCVEMWLGTEKDNEAANALYKSLKPDEIEDFTGYNFKISP